tara:strand:- start:11060 stop:11215 length:156 start_codon:yes stop_codon:yes gene_type:complete
MKIKPPNPVHKQMLQSRKFQQKIIPGRKKDEARRIAEKVVQEYKKRGGDDE